MEIVVLGCGPSGLLAAWAVIQCGHKPIIIDKSPKRPDGKSAGVFYLHADCDLPLRSIEIDVIPSGAKSENLEESYRRKVYKTDDPAIEVSIPRKRSKEVIYDGMQGMSFAWDIVHLFIQRREIESWEQVVGYLENFPYVVNTIPISVLLPYISFPSKKACIYTNDAPPDESYSLYNANSCVPWYRASAAFGRFTLEYVPDYFPDSLEHCHFVQKVISAPHLLPEVPKNMLLAGRYGSWDKSKLSHNVYYDVLSFLNGF